MTEHDVLFGFRLRVFTLAEELGSVSEACRQMGISRSTFYRWKPKLERYGLDGLRVRERRRPRMPNQIGPHLEHRVIAFALGHPGFGARRISAELRRPKWGGIEISEHGVWRVLRRFNLNTRAKRFALIARHSDPYETRPIPAPKELHIDATEPGEKVEMDCFYVGRLAGAKGVVWQYTAIDVASAYTWAFLRSEERNPSARRTAELCHLVVSELRLAGWRLRGATSDNGSEFRSRFFRDAVEGEGARHRRIKARLSQIPRISSSSGRMPSGCAIEAAAPTRCCYSLNGSLIPSPFLIRDESRRIARGDGAWPTPPSPLRACRESEEN